MPFTLVIASANPHKALELRDLLHSELGDSVNLLDRPTEIPDVDESGSTLEENARLKAQAIANATGFPAISDDTGLEVMALGGAPGVYSARYAGPGATDEENLKKLLRVLAGETDRRARFRTVCVVSFPDGRELIADGVADGLIATTPLGTEGFGYDSAFIPLTDPAHTFAQMSLAKKQAISHRGVAVRAVATLLASVLESDSAS